MINKRWITLPVVYSRPFASKAVFWAILNEFQFTVDCSCLSIIKNSQRRRRWLFFIIERQGWKLVLKGFQRRSDFSLQNRIASLSNFAALRSKDPRFFSYLPIENPSKRPGASPRRKSKSNSFRATVMRSEILTCQPQTVFLTIERRPIRKGQSAGTHVVLYSYDQVRLLSSILSSWHSFSPEFLYIAVLIHS